MANWARRRVGRLAWGGSIVYESCLSDVALALFFSREFSFPFSPEGDCCFHEYYDVCIHSAQST